MLIGVRESARLKFTSVSNNLEALQNGTRSDSKKPVCVWGGCCITPAHPEHSLKQQADFSAAKPSCSLIEA